MPDQVNIDALKARLAEDQRQELLTELQLLVSPKGKLNYLQKHISALQARNSALQSKEDQNLIEPAKAGREAARIRKAIIDVLHEIEAPKPFSWRMKSTGKRLLKPANLVILAILIPVVIFGLEQFLETRARKGKIEMVQGIFDSGDSDYETSNDSIVLAAEAAQAAEPEAFATQALQLPEFPPAVLTGAMNTEFEVLANDSMRRAHLKSRPAPRSNQLPYGRPISLKSVNLRKQSVLKDTSTNFNFEDLHEASDQKSIITRVSNEQLDANKYLFPTVDFAFFNEGEQTVLITEFAIENRKLSLDVSPILSFTWAIDGNRNLLIRAKNDGWGEAGPCTCTFSNPVLNLLFSAEELTSSLDIPDGKTTLLATLKPENASVSALSDRLRGLIATNSNEYGPDVGIPVLNHSGGDYHLVLEAVCRYSTEDNQSRNFTETVRSSSINNTAFLTIDGFVHNLTGTLRSEQQSNAYTPSTLTYITFVDSGPTVTYKTLHEIQPGKTDRFHILLGTRKSCFSETRIRFTTNSGKHIYSDWMNLKLYAPRNFEIPYEDGMVYYRDQGLTYAFKER